LDEVAPQRGDSHGSRGERDSRQLTKQLRDDLFCTVAPLLPKGGPVALVDFPRYENVGDHLIWLGELEMLRALGRDDPVYTCDLGTYAPKLLKRRLGDGTICISGGGNLGDLWPKHQLFRERLILDFPDNRIVQLPQTIHFRASESLKRARDVFRAHPDLTLLVRDEESRDVARDHLHVPATVCPDAAFALGPLARGAEPEHDVLWLRRSDKESAETSHAPDGIVVADWIAHQDLRGERIRKVLAKLMRKAPTALRGPIARGYELKSRQRLRAGCSLLSSARVVVTDRLHAHILCLLLDIPHFLLDNNYGKIRGFFDRWTHGSPLVTWCESSSEALERAARIGVAGRSGTRK
jgi:exopolysaccharide biosynthesis predicted pyruvyltransferase EpsI